MNIPFAHSHLMFTIQGVDLQYVYCSTYWHYYVPYISIFFYRIKRIAITSNEIFTKHINNVMYTYIRYSSNLFLLKSKVYFRARAGKENAML